MANQIKRIQVSLDQSFTKIVLLIFILSLVTRFAMFIIGGPVIETDSVHYIGVSENIVQFGAVLEKDSFTGQLRPQTLRTPGYPVLMALFLKIFGSYENGLNALVIFQIIIISGISILVAIIGKRYFSTKVGVLAALISAFDPWLSYASLAVLTEALFSFFFILSFLIGALAVQKRNWQWALWWGAIFALCTYIRPVTQHHYLIPFIIFATLPINLSRKLLLIAVSLIGFSLLVGIWIYRNKVITGEPVLVTHQGMSLLWETTYLTRKSSPEDFHEDAQLAKARNLVAETPVLIARSLAENPDQEHPPEGRIAYTNLRQELGYSEYEADAILKEIAIENILANPIQYLFIIAPRNIVIFLTSISRPISFGINLGLIKSDVIENLQEGRIFYPLFNLGLRLFTFFSFVPLLILGVIVSWRRFPRSRYLTLAFLISLFYHFLVVAFVVADDRYRLPLHGLVWLYVGLSVISFPWTKMLALFRIKVFRGLVK